MKNGGFQYTSATFETISVQGVTSWSRPTLIGVCLWKNLIQVSNLDYNVYLSGTVAKCHLHKNLYQNPLTKAPSPEYTVSGDYGASAAGGSAKGLSSHLTFARIYCLNDQTSHVKSNPSLTGVKIFYPHETAIPLQSICEVMILIGGRDYYPYE